MLRTHKERVEALKKVIKEKTKIVDSLTEQMDDFENNEEPPDAPKVHEVAVQVGKGHLFETEAAGNEMEMVTLETALVK